MHDFRIYFQSLVFLAGPGTDEPHGIVLEDILPEYLWVIQHRPEFTRVRGLQILI